MATVPESAADIPPAEAALPRRTLFFYSLCDLPVTMSLFPVLVFVPKFYSTDLGIPLVLAANILLAVRIFDMVSDPLVGWLSDHTHSRWGRRRPWILASMPIMTLGFYMLFLPPSTAGWGWMLGWMMFLSLGTTMMMIPYYAWAAEMSPDYNERSRITGWRSMMGVVGSLAAQILPSAALILFGIGGSGTVLAIVGITMLVLLPMCVLLTVTQVQEPSTRSLAAADPGAGGPRVGLLRQLADSRPWSIQAPIDRFVQGLRLMITNVPFLLLIAGFTIGSIALSITTPLYLFYITFVLGAEEKATFMLTFFYLSTFLGVPCWVKLAGHIGKHRAYMGALVLIALSHPFYLLLGAGDFWWMLPVTIASGFAAGSFAALPNSMKADVIDLDTVRSGENRAALFFSAWSFAMKMSGSLGGWIALMGLAWVGFRPELGGGNSADALFGLAALFAVFPSTFFLLAAALLWFYPIDATRQAELRAQLAATR